LATSGSYDYTQTRDDIIKRALRLVGALAQGETPTTDQVTEAAVALNGLVKAWQADGMPLWAIKEVTVPFVLDTSSYSLSSPRPLKVLQAWNRNTASDVDIPMRIVTKDEYNRLGNKTSAGNPIQVFYDPSLGTGVLHVFPVPTSNEVSNNELHLVYQAPFADFDASTDTPDFPQEWFDAVTYGLATRLAPEYGLPIPDRKTLWQEMTIIKQDALNFGLEEGSLFFQVDRRGY